MDIFVTCVLSITPSLIAAAGIYGLEQLLTAAADGRVDARLGGRFTRRHSGPAEMVYMRARQRASV
jgi:hypothetical protein